MSAGGNNFIDLTGKRFGRLSVIRRDGATGSGKILWACICDCGNSTIASGSNLKIGHVSSCGCLNSELAASRKRTHGMRNTSIYRIWYAMKDRCTNQNNAHWKDYGGRGIKVCCEWLDSFEAFYGAVGNPPPGLTLDRENNDGNYEPGNVRWATRSQQRINQRRRAA